LLFVLRRKNGFSQAIGRKRGFDSPHPLIHLQKSDRGSGHTQSERVHPSAPTFTLSERRFVLAEKRRYSSDSFFRSYRNYLSTRCVAHLRIWNGTKERKPDTAAT